MAQISYGTITITDTNDIESIIVEYARNQSTSSAPTSGWSTTRPTWAQGYYIWQRTRTHKAGTSADSDIYGTAVCITGSTGQTGGTGAAGRSLTNTVTQYTIATNSATITQSNMGNYTWNSNVPSYSSSTPAYWVRVTNTYSNPSSTEYIIYKDNGLTDAIAKSVEANNNAATANSIAQHANENAQGAMSQAAEAQYQTEALAAKVKHYWWDSTGAHIASGINGADITEGTASTYGFNSLVGLASMTFGYNSYKTVELDGSVPALKFYKPSKTAQGALTATLDSNGLILSEGGVKAGTAGQSGFIYLSTKNYGSNLTINSHTASNWREIIGTKFGVDAEGNLYASNVEISGKITASSLTIGSGATVSGLSTSNISGMNSYALQSSLDTEVAQRKAIYAVSTTGATTAAKTTESGTPSGFVLYNGATVTVKFNNANSTTTPTLNVNGTGAKTIKSYTGAALTAAEYTWPAGAAITFTYDGSYWRMQDGGALEAKADAAASASAASGSATAASNSANAASTSASSASTSASNASNSASAASTSASTASTKASEASTSASTASTKASAASTSATNAANSASAASTSATNASNSASAAADSASDASDSADAAAGSASTASSKATAAANSATSASNSASSASSSATSASNSASSASSSATTATNQANAAAGSATAASNSATAASGSATAASNSATAASNSATAASNSATAASNSATAAAEVMGGFTILWNYSAFGTSTAGDAYICGFDPATGTKSDANGWVKWNSTKRTITKQQVNPGTIVPYNIPIYIVCRLSSATGTTGTNYMVWYNSGWKYAACPSPTAVGGSWTWTDNRDIILGSFVETGANEVLTECELFNPPWTSKQITTNTTTPTSYITEVTENNGIRIHPKNTENHSIIINSNGIELFKGGTTSANSIAFYGDTTRIGKTTGGYTTIASTGMKIYGYNGGLELANIGYGSGNAQVGIDDAPYYTFGLRKSSGTIGNYSIAEGRMVIASGACSHAEGGTTQATNYASHAEGASTMASGPQAHAEGSDTIASGYHSHAEGQNTTASSSDSHAEGQSTTASGNASHSEGHSTTASGAYSHASGYHTIAAGNYQTVVGKYNTSNTSDLFIVGNGSSTITSNAFTVSSSGNITMYLNSSATTGVDYRIRNNLTLLGWNDCII